MKSLPLASILISPTRQRREFDPARLNSLREDIEQHGLFHPIVLRSVPEGLQLVSGERRLRAISDLHDLGQHLQHDSEMVPAGHIPYVELGELSSLDAELAEWSENAARIDLTWDEQCLATARIHRLRTEVAARDGGTPPSVADIAAEVRPGRLSAGARDDTRKELIVADHLHRPEVRAAKNTDEAFKIIRKAESEAQNVALAVAVGRTFSSASHTVLNADATEWLAGCPDNQFDVILTDQPFGMGADEFADGGGAATADHGYKDDEEVFQSCLRALLAHGQRITKPEAHLYWFCDIDRFHEGRERFANAGWWVHRTPLIWHKPQSNRTPWPQHGPQRKYELILYAVKGKRPVIYANAPDVITWNADPVNLGNSAQKPVGLLVELLKRSARPGDRVLDPFAGTGSILPAAHQMKLLATAVERDPAQYGIMLNRLKELK